VDFVVADDAFAALPALAQDFFRHYAYRPLADEGVWYLNGDFAKFMNHSDHPNIQSTSDATGGHDVALRDIEIGEELTADYREFEDPELLAATAISGTGPGRPAPSP
jgi:hypothetical protein